jgi:glycosyltransferase involved in cell wall biosynthesis
MKILLITPKFPNDLARLFNLTTTPFGGWIDGLVNNLNKFDDISLNIAVFNKSNEDSINNKAFDNINCFYINYSKDAIKTFFKDNIFDVIHIIGIEHAYIKNLKDYLPYDRTLINITGIQYEYAKVFMSKYNKFNEIKNPLLHLNLKLQNKIITNRGNVEKEVLRKANYVVGRTDWDKNSVLSINPDLTYFKCNETLRDVFYTHKKWKFNNCEKHTLFVSQGASPIKGTHMVLEIVKLLKKQFPNVKCYIAGEDITKSKSIFTLLNANYASLIKKLIKKYNLKDNIVFTGFLNEEQIAEKMITSHVFLMPSSIENSVNSLQEAMILGLPCVSSLVGGVPSLIDKDSCLTYKFDDPQDASSKISLIFNSAQVASFLSDNGINRIVKLANPNTNTNQMINIYKSIVGDNNEN